MNYARFVVFAIGTAIGGYLAYWLGNKSLVNIISLCTGLLEASFLPVVILLLIAIVPLLLFEKFGLEESLLGYLITFGVTLGLSTLLPLALTIGGSNVAFVRSIFCTDCTTPASVSQLIDQGKVDEAYALASTFVDGEAKRMAALPEGTPSQVMEFSRGCIADGERLMARAMYLQTSDDVDTLVALNAYDDDSRTQCEQVVSDTNAMLDEIEQRASKVDDADLMQQVRERRERVRELAKKCQPEVLINVVEVNSAPEQLTVDVQLFAGDAKDMLKGMEGSLQVWNGSQQLPVDVVERSADDKACVILVADSSGSIKDADLEDVRKSVDVLNELRKRGDYFGLITFGGKDEITNDSLRNDAINRDLINNDGGYTAIWDATLVGISEMQASCPPAIEQRYVLLMTDGQDNQSEFMSGESEVDRASALKAQAQDANIDVCVVGVTEDITASGTDVALTALATDCGYRYVDTFSELADEFQSVFGNEQEYYRITLAQQDVGSNKNLTLRILGTEVAQPILIP